MNSVNSWTNGGVSFTPAKPRGGGNFQREQAQARNRPRNYRMCQIQFPGVCCNTYCSCNQEQKNNDCETSISSNHMISYVHSAWVGCNSRLVPLRLPLKSIAQITQSPPILLFRSLIIKSGLSVDIGPITIYFLSCNVKRARHM